MTATATATASTWRLTGPGLPTAYRSMLADGATKSEIVRACGYASIKENGTERLHFTDFYEALLNETSSREAAGCDHETGRHRSPVALLIITAEDASGCPVPFRGPSLPLMVGRSGEADSDAYGAAW